MYRPRRKVVRRRRRFVRKPRTKRMNKPHTRWFSEAFYAGSINSNSGGLFQTRFNDLPQAPSYSKLWNEFCIKKFVVTLVPYLGGVDANQALANANATPAIPVRYTGRLLTSNMDVPQQNAPTSEVDMLIDNGVKIHVNSSGRAIKLVCYPKPDFEAVDTGILNTYVGVRQKGLQWLNTTNASVNYDGQNVLYNGIRWWLNVPTAPSGAQVAYYDVYYKVTFGMRSPA